MPYADPEKQKAYQREWGKRHRPELRIYLREWYKRQSSELKAVRTHQKNQRGYATQRAYWQKPENRERRRLRSRELQRTEAYHEVKTRWRVKNKEHIARTVRNKHLQWKFGITIDQEEAQLRKQEGKCAICQRLGLKLGWDHNHTTSQVREMLCTQCNSIIGHARENRLVLLAAIAYLDKWVH